MADPPDVAHIALEEVESAEDEALLDRFQQGEPVLIQCRERIPLRAVLVGAVGAGAAHLIKTSASLITKFVEAPIDLGDVSLFGGETRIGRGGHLVPYLIDIRRKRQAIHYPSRRLRR